MTQSEKTYTLMTGATGLVGRYLMRNALAAGERLAVIVRASAKQSVVERVETIVQMWETELGKSLPRPVCLEGNVSAENLGLDNTAIDWVQKNCRRMVHGAAVLTFHGSDREREPWATNLNGTRNVLDLCRKTEIKDLHYVSTAYVCGTREDLVREDELDVGQDFRNDYERSKFEAEKLVRASDFLDQLTVYRPAVISGDSRNGYTNTYHGLYLYLRLMAMLVPTHEPDENGVRHTPIRLPMTGEEPRNIVPIDWVADVIYRLMNTPEAHGGTYHLSPRTRLTPRKIIDYCYTYFNSTGVEYVGDTPIPPEDMNDFERAYLGNILTYNPYNSNDPEFDTSNLLEFTADMPCPDIDEAMMHRYLDYGQADRWGKRRERTPGIPFAVADYLQQAGLLTLNGDHKNGNGVHHGNGSALRPVLGLDVCGPGGGQWRLERNGGPKLELAPGLPKNSTPVLRLETDDFATMANNGQVQPNELQQFLAGDMTASVQDLTDASQTLFPCR